MLPDLLSQSLVSTLLDRSVFVLRRYVTRFLMSNHTFSEEESFWSCTIFIEF